MLVFKQDKLLVRDQTFDLPAPERYLRASEELPAIWSNTGPWCEVDENASCEGEWIDLRTLWLRWGDRVFIRVGTAYQYMNWLRNTSFCSACGSPLKPRDEERALRCLSCGRTVYAPLHPAVIVAVEKEGNILLAHNARMPSSRYSVLAGFVEPGESLEETVQREIREEVGIEIQDIRYFGSQPWPFPCSLMLGFTARWKSGELKPDGVELDRAEWFAPDALPDIPTGISIARLLIDDFLARFGKIC